MIGPLDVGHTGAVHRIDTIAGLADAVESIDVRDIPRSLLLLSVACVDVTELGAQPVVAEAFSQWRADGRVAPSVSEQVARLARDAESCAGDPRVDAMTRSAAFRCARALGTLQFASAATAELPQPLLRGALRESCYEASFVLNGAAGVAAVLGCRM